MTEPIYEQLSEHFEQVRLNAYKRGRLQAQLEIITHITSLTGKKYTWTKAAESLIKYIEKMK